MEAAQAVGTTCVKVLFYIPRKSDGGFFQNSETLALYFFTSSTLLAARDLLFQAHKLTCLVPSALLLFLFIIQQMEGDC